MLPEKCIENEYFSLVENNILEYKALLFLLLQVQRNHKFALLCLMC